MVETVLDGLLKVITDVCHDFGGVVRFSMGDGYCLTFTDVARAMAGLERLVATWGTFIRKAELQCSISIGVHKGTLYAFRSYLHGRDLNTAFRVEHGAQGSLGDDGAIAVTDRVRNDLVGTRWDGRLERVPLDAMPTRLEGMTLYRLRKEERAT